jgi:hypothetical protein
MTSQEQAELEEYCRDLYRRTAEYWNERKDGCATENLGFGILYGPPKVRPPLLIVATNPGYDEDDDSKTWPNTNLFAVYPPPPPRQRRYWTLTSRLMHLFCTPEQQRTLSDSVPTNILFFKSRGLQRRGHGLAWEDNPRELREDLERYCREALRDLVPRIDPDRILVLGMGAYNKIKESKDECKCVNGTRLFCKGIAFGKPTLAIVHPAEPAGIFTNNQGDIRDALSEFLT